MLDKIKYYIQKLRRPGYLAIDKKRREVPVEPWAFIRVKNEIATLDACLKSILPVIKKGVIGYHKLNPNEKDDGTEEYIKNFCRENPGFILYKHDYEVIPACDERYKNLEDISDENTLAGYYNAVLSQIPKGEWLIKIDCDHIYDSEKLRQLMYLPKMDNDVISISRFNLHYENDKLYVLKNRAVINPKDHWLIKNDDFKFFMDCGYENGNFYAWEQSNLKEKIRKNRINMYDTNLINWHFPNVKASRHDYKEPMIQFDQFKLSYFKRKFIYYVDNDMLDEERILEICRKFKIKNIK